MKISKIIANEPLGVKLQPSVVAQQQRVGKMVAQIAASDQLQQPTEMEKVLAMRVRAAQQKQSDKGYAAALMQQLRLVLGKTRRR